MLTLPQLERCALWGSHYVIGEHARAVKFGATYITGPAAWSRLPGITVTTHPQR